MASKYSLEIDLVDGDTDISENNSLASAETDGLGSVTETVGGGSLYKKENSYAMWNEWIEKLDDPGLGFSLYKRDNQLYRKVNGIEKSVSLDSDYNKDSKLVGLASHYQGFDINKDFMPLSSNYFNYDISRECLNPYAVDQYLYEKLNVHIEYDGKNKSFSVHYPDELRKNPDLYGYSRFLVAFVKKNHDVVGGQSTSSAMSSSYRSFADLVKEKTVGVERRAVGLYPSVSFGEPRQVVSLVKPTFPRPITIIRPSFSGGQDGGAKSDHPVTSAIYRRFKKAQGELERVGGAIDKETMSVLKSRMKTAKKRETRYLQKKKRQAGGGEHDLMIFEGDNKLSQDIQDIDKIISALETIKMRLYSSSK
jgi:hypothetical protein